MSPALRSIAALRPVARSLAASSPSFGKAPSLVLRPTSTAAFTAAFAAAAAAAAASAAARRCFATSRLTMAPQAFFKNEPDAPILKSAKLPGPEGARRSAELSEVFDTRSINIMADYPKSVGNYLATPDGDMLLDVYAQIASIPVGYNNPHLAEIASSPQMVDALINRPALGNFPSHDWAEILKKGILKVAPKGLGNVFTALAGSDANELAFKAAFIYRRQQERGGPDVAFTEEELQSAMNNQKPGSPELSILSFRTAFHGRLFGTLSCTRSKPIHKIDIPAFDWPQASFPQLKYPLDQHATENAEAERAALAEVEHLIQTWPKPPAAVIVEPIQSEGGDNHASPAFFRGLRALTRRLGVLLIVDEVQTGVGATGRFWAHDHWDLPHPPDMVTFSKKAQTAGFYYGDHALRPNLPYRQFNTWMGDPARALINAAIVDEIERLDLVRHTARVGDYLFAKMELLAARYPDHFRDLRGKGQGTFIAFDSPKRDAFLAKAKEFGVNIGGSGASAVRLRPMLIFQEHHADILLDAFEKIVKAL